MLRCPLFSLCAGVELLRAGGGNNRRVHPSTVRPPRARLKAGGLGDGRSPQSKGFRAQILSPRGEALGGSGHQPYRAVRLMGVYG